MEKDLQLSEIIEIAEFYRYEPANEYLKLGWVLISTHVQGQGNPRERQESTCYCLGWPKSQGEVKRPKSKYDTVGRFVESGSPLA